MKNYLIYGNGVSGKALYKLLKTDAIVHIYDDNTERSEISFKQALSLFSSLDCLILSPGVSRNSLLCKLVEASGIPIIGEFEFSAKRCLATQVAITGTNGKTTTTEMLHHILNYCGITAKLLGNGGIPFASQCSVMGKEHIAVLEVSSFQLEGFTDYKPYISAILNITPDHLDRHGSYQSYISAKRNVFASQMQNSFTVLCKDDVNCRSLFNEVKGKLLSYSLSDHTADCYYGENEIICNIRGDCYKIPTNIEHYVCHNISNIVCAAAISLLLGAKTIQISEAIRSFTLSPHRVEFCGEVNGVDFYNDSKATNIDATLSAIDNFRKICLIVGGSDKGLNYEKLFLFPEKLDFVACIGKTAPKILKAAKCKNFERISFFVDLQEAVKACYAYAKESGATVLLSPACASFDTFSDYKQRGEKFREIVRTLSALSDDR